MGFALSAGIRQGCPLSPLIFVLAADILLRRIGRALPGSTFRAYADDLALVTPDLEADLPALTRLFWEYERISGLTLNIAKTVLVPLDGEDLEVAKSVIGRAAPTWGAVRIQSHAEYLGFILGPGGTERSWIKPLRNSENAE